MITREGIARPRARLRIDADDVLVTGVRADGLVITIVCPLCSTEHMHMWRDTDRGDPGWRSPPCTKRRASSRYWVESPADPEPAHLADLIAQIWTGRPKRRRRRRPRIIMKSWRS